MSQEEQDKLGVPDMEIEENPLLIDVVLNGIFEYLQVEDLKICRAVCYLWNSSVLASSSWKRGVKVNARPGAVVDQTVATFWKLVENGTCFSETYSIHDSTIPQVFWSNCGTWIKILRLQFIKFESNDDFRTVVYKACPNMEQLSLYNIVIVSEHERMEELKVNECTKAGPRFGERKNMKYLAVQPFRESDAALCMELLCHFPNLQALHLNSRDHSLSGFFNWLSEFRQAFPTKLKVKHITLETRTNPYPGVFKILMDPGLELQTINTELWCQPDDLNEILSMHASSLKKLVIRFADRRKVYPHQIFHFPAEFCNISLDSLQVLEVDENPFYSMAILKYTPNLKVLKVGGNAHSAIRNTKGSEMGGVSLKKCKTLIVSFDISLESLRKLVSWLPNVEKLKLKRMTNAHFQMVCENCPNLVALVSPFATVDDVGITGLDEEDVRRINYNGQSSDWRPITVPRANISTLKELRSLYIRGSDRLGYCAATCGVELVPKLEQLSLPCYKLTGSIWERLQSLLPEADHRFKQLQDLSDAFYF